MYASRFVLAVNDLAVSTAFYMDVLGFVKDFDAPGWVFLSREGIRMMLGECVDEAPAGEIGNHSYFAYINVRDADALYAEIVAKGGEPWAKPVNKAWGLREFGISSPDGHRMVFGQTL